MPRRGTRTVPTVLLAEHDGQGWPVWLAGRLTDAGREVRFPVLPDGADLQQWREILAGTLAGLPDDGYDLIAHSLACLLWLHHATDGAPGPRPSRVALVAPPRPDQPRPGAESFYPVPLVIDALRRAADGTVLVGGDDDPQCPGGVARTYGAPLKMAATVVAGSGGLDAASGYGPWPAVLDWCGRDNLAFIA